MTYEEIIERKDKINMLFFFASLNKITVPTEMNAEKNN